MGKCQIILNPQGRYVKALAETRGIGFDLETSIADHPRNGKIRLYQAYLPDLNVTLIWDAEPTLIEIGDIPKIITPTAVAENESFQLLLRQLENPEVEVRIHNALFEYGYMRNHHGLKITNVLDTLVLSQVTKAGLHKSYTKAGIKHPNSLANLSDEYDLGLDKTYQTYDYSDPKPIPLAVYRYAAEDAWATWELGELIPRPEQDIDLLMTEVFGELNYLGLPVNVECIKDMYEAYKTKADELYDQIKKETGCNPNSPSQLMKWIGETFGMLPKMYDKKTRLLKPSTSKPALTNFIIAQRRLEKDAKLIELLEKVQRYRSVKKRADFPKDFLAKEYNGRVCGQYSVFGFQGTGRSASRGPNVQNIATKSSPVRERYELPITRTMVQAHKGWILVEIDFAACHAQIVEHYSEDRSLREAKETGIKLHYFTMQGILAFQGIHMTAQELKQARADENHQYHKIVNDHYHLAKTVFYSFLNFSGPATLQQAFLKEDVMMPFEVCAKMLKATEKTYADLRGFLEALCKKINNRNIPVFTKDGKFLGAHGYIKLPDKSIIYHRVPVFAPDVGSSFWLRLESTASKRSLLRVNEIFKQRYVGTAELVNFSHDSLLVHCEESLAHEVGQLVADIMVEEIIKLCPTYLHEKSDEGYDYELYRIWKK